MTAEPANNSTPPTAALAQSMCQWIEENVEEMLRDPGSFQLGPVQRHLDDCSVCRARHASVLRSI